MYGTKTRRTLFSIALLLVLGIASPLYAATFYFDPVQVTIGEGQTRSISLLINPNGEYINAIAGNILIPTDAIEVVDIDTSQSVVELWLEQPSFDGASIRFAGIMPNGFDGIRKPYGDEKKSGIVLTVKYKALASGSVPIVLENIEAYQNDGEATPAEVEIVPGVIDVVPTARAVTNDDIVDETKPERFSPTLVSNPQLYDGKRVVVFHTVDRGSGIDHYEVAEVAPQTDVTDADWKQATSPYVLREQSKPVDVYVKAIDNTGNSRTAKASPDSTVPVQGERRAPLTLLLLLLLALVFVIVIRRMYFKR